MKKYFLFLNTLSVILFACNGTAQQADTDNASPGMTQYQKNERNKAIALGCIRAFQTNDDEFIVSHNADNVVNIVSGRPVYGLDSCRILLQQYHSMMKEFKPGNTVAAADSNYVFVFMYVDITYNKSPETTHNKSVQIFRFNDDGKIVMHSSVDEQLEPNSPEEPLSAIQLN